MRASLLFFACLAAACVPQGKYDEAIRQNQVLSQTAAGQAHDLETSRTEIAKLNEALDRARAEIQARETRLSDASVQKHNLEAELDQATAVDEQLRHELEGLGKNVDQLLSEKGELSTALAQAKSRLDELRKAQEASEAGVALYRDLAMKFQKMIDKGELRIVLRDGRMILQLSNDVLFDSAKVDLKPQGKVALKDIAAGLASLQGRRFQVAGHTDNVPIQTPRFASNWELSTSRAVEVVKFLVAQGIKPDALSAAGYGEFNPIAANDSPEGKARNRRIEITLQPNIEAVSN